MSYALIIYLMDVIGNIDVTLGLLLFLCIIMAVFVGVNYFVDGNERCGKWFKSLIGVVCVCSILLVLIPSNKTMYAMVGASVAQKIIEDPRSKEISDKVLLIVNQKLDGTIKSK